MHRNHHRAASAIALLVTGLLAGTAALASPTCDVPKERWMKEEAFKSKIAAQGYDIKTFKVTKGNCYEIYGTDKAGKKVEIYFNPETAEILERK